MSGWRIIEGDSLDVMRAMATAGESVDAIVTSPPYYDQRTYADDETHRSSGQSGRRARARSRKTRSSAPHDWVRWLEPYTAAMLDVVAAGGSLILNLGVVHRDGEELSCPHDAIANARRQGWRLLHTQIWDKPNGQVPSDPRYLTISHEYAFWLFKGERPYTAYSEPVGSEASREVRRPHSAKTIKRLEGPFIGDPMGKRGKGHKPHPDGARPTTTLSYAVGGDPNPDGHSARMPIKLALDLVARCCPPGGIVLDPFCGNATTGAACLARGRRFVGIEIEPHHAEGSRRRLRESAPLFAQEAEPAEDLGSPALFDINPASEDEAA